VESARRAFGVMLTNRPGMPSQPPLRIYLVGAHATGKTTVARWVRDTYGIPMIAEVARGVLAEMEAHLDTLRTDIELVNRYQAEVFSRQIEAEHKVDGPFVSDRAFCNLAYAAHHSTILGQVFADPRLRDYMHWVREGVRIDGMVKLLLELFSVPYIPVESLSMQERSRLVERVLGLAGLPRPAKGIGAPAPKPNGNGNGHATAEAHRG
jgi:hypothetical protein